MAGQSHPKYRNIYIWLVILFLVSVAGPEAADILGLEGATRMLLVLSTAFGIAIVKAYMVCAYFMHLKFEKIYAPYILLTCLALLFVFFFGVATDIMKADGHNWEKPYEEPVAVSGGHGDHGGHGHGSHSEEGHDDGH